MVRPFFWTTHPPGYDALVKAIEKRDRMVVEKVLKSGVNPNSYPNDWENEMMEEDMAPINIAASDGRDDIVRLLLDHGADPNLGDGFFANPLAAAAEEDHIETMRLLMSHGATVNDDKDGSGALWRAAVDGKVRAVNLLLDSGANPNTRGAGTTLYRAVEELGGSKEVLRLLRKYGAH